MSRTCKWFRHVDRAPRETRAWFRSMRWISRAFKKHPDQWEILEDL